VEKGRPEYDALVRQTRWGDGPIFVVASGASLATGLTAAYAFESLLGWPVVVREAVGFLAYSTSVLHPRSVLLAISPGGEEPETLEVARLARGRGATVLALTHNARGALAKMATGTFLVRAGAGEEASAGVKATVCAQAAASLVGLVAARALRRPSPQLDAMDADFAKLPAHAESAFRRLADAVRAFAAELQGWQRLAVVGAGFYHPAALQWASFVTKLSGVDARGFEVAELMAKPLPSWGSTPPAVVVLSGSRCRTKERLHQLVQRLRKVKIRTLAVTDSNEPEVSRRADLAVLLPVLTEMAGSTLALAWLDWAAYEASRGQGRARGSLPLVPC
jgi:glucosamine--fructose-6-phosphate aminotransferase (isomerizing)